jgi:hypothetical protein
MTETQDNPAGMPPAESETQLGPNPFEEAYHAEVSHEEPQPEQAPEGQLEAGVEALSTDFEKADRETSFLSNEEQAGFDTTSPEYKAMQASFTKKMQSLSEEKRGVDERQQSLMDRIAHLEGRAPEQSEQPAASNAAQEGVSFDGMNLSPAPVELEDYDEFFTNRVKEVASHVVQQLEQRAVQDETNRQATELRGNLTKQVEEFKTDPNYSDYEKYFPAMQEMAQASPAMLRKADGLKRLYRLAKMDAGDDTILERPVNEDEQYARGLKAGLDQLQARRASAVSQSPTASAPTAPAPTQYATLDAAVNAEFAKAVAAARGQ